MSYQPYLIANYATGLDRQLQPWLGVDDAFYELFDGYVYRGVTNKRDGYSGFANGSKSTYVESRLVHTITAEAYGTGSGISGPYTHTAANIPVARGSVTITAGLQSYTDNGLGYFLNPTINILAVALSNPAEITTAVNHGYSTGDQVVLANIGGTTQLNRNLAYTITVTALNKFTLDGIDSTGYTPYTSGGTTALVAGTINYTTGQMSITFSAVVPGATPITVTYDYHQGLPVMGIMRFYPNLSTNIPELIVADTTYVNKYDRATDRFVDITVTPYNGTYQDFWSWVNYATPTFTARLLFANGKSGDEIQQWDGTTLAPYAYTSATITKLNARQIFEFQDRLILFQTTETVGLTTTFYPRRIRISGFGTNCDNFDLTAPGAGFIDIPDNTFFFGAAFNRDDLMFFTEAATWLLKYTGNDVNPFILKKVDGSRGSKAAFSVISYLNRTMAASPRGLIIVDGYNVERMDEVLPDFAYNSINNDEFQSCFSGFIDEDRDVYTLYPSKGDVRPALVAAGSSDRILVSNFEEDVYSIYKLPLSCMGNFEVTNTITWADLTPAKGFANWDDLAAKYASWNAFPYSKGVPIALGGGHKGEVWKLTENEIQDNPQPIRAITIVDLWNIQVTTDWNNYEVGDYIFFTAVQGMTQINGKQGVIQSIDTNFTKFTVKFAFETTDFDAYTTGGTASRTVPFNVLSKKFNPFVATDRKVKCGWIYFYVTCTATTITDEDDNFVTPFLEVDLYMNDYKDPTTPFETPEMTYKVDLSASSSNNTTFNQEKKWVKIWVNQVGKFLQFRIRNTQAGTKIQIQAMMPGFAPAGRLIS